MSLNETATMKQFRERVKDVLHLTPYNSDDDLRHWLVARNFNQDAASDMFRKSMAWRSSFGVNDILQWQPPEAIRQYFPHGSPGVDKQGHRVYIFNIGMSDMRGLLRCCKRTDLLNFGILMMERFKSESLQQSEKLGRHLGRSGLIIDLEHLQLSQLTDKPGMEVFLQFIQLFEANYPDTLGWCMGINVPAIFSLAWAVISPLLNEVTRSKVQLLGVGAWQQQLLQLVDPGQLPEYWGGTLSGPDQDPKYPEKIVFGSEVPKHLYTQLDTLKCLEQKLPEHLEVRAGSRLGHSLHVAQSGSSVSFRFVTKGGEVYFRVYRSGEEGEDDVEVFPLRLVFSHQHPEDGCFVASRPGKYNIEFDNSASYWRKRDVFLSFVQA